MQEQLSCLHLTSHSFNISKPQTTNNNNMKFLAPLLFAIMLATSVAVVDAIAYGNTYLALGGRLNLSWTVDATLIHVKMEATAASANEFFALGFSTSGMGDGGARKAISCRRPTAAQPTTTCQAGDLSSNSWADSATPAVTVVSALYNAAGAFRSVVEFSAPKAALASAAGTRFVYALGSIASGATPTQHAVSDRGSSVGDFSQGGTGGATMEPTTPAAGTATPAPPSNTFVGLDDRFGMQWSVFTNSTGDFVSLILTSATAHMYTAVAFSPSAMAGRGVACKPPTAAAPTEAVCTVIDLVNYDALKSSKQNAVIKSISYTASDARPAKVVVEMPTEGLGLSKSVRFIFAQGTWNSAANMPTQHAVNDRRSATADFSVGGTGGAGGAIARASIKWWRLAASVACCWGGVFIWALLGRLSFEYHTRRANTTAFVRINYTAMFLLYIFASIICTYAAYVDLDEAGRPASIQRALGASLCWHFSVVLLPTTRFLSLARVAGSSYERVIQLHAALVGPFIFVVSTAHLISMGVFGRDSGRPLLLTGEGADPSVSVLPALIGYALLCLLTVTSVFRKAMYNIHRMVHFLTFPAILALFAVHFNPLAVAFAPAALVLIADFVLRAVTEEKVEIVSIDHASGITKLVVRTENQNGYNNGKVEPGQYCLIRAFKLAYVMHPFTIADVSRDDNRVLTFLIRDMRAESGSSDGGFTNTLKKYALQEPGFAVKDLSDSLHLFRPCGSLQVAIDAKPTAVLCAGGVGVTPMLAILSNIGRNAAAYFAAGTLSRVVFVWFAREQGLVTMASSIINDAVLAAAASNCPIKFDINIFVTSNKGDSASIDVSCFSAIGALGNVSLSISAGKRADVAEIFARQQGECAVFNCGPEGFMATVAEETGKRQGWLLHEEVFAF